MQRARQQHIIRDIGTNAFGLNNLNRSNTLNMVDRNSLNIGEKLLLHASCVSPFIGREMGGVDVRLRFRRYSEKASCDGDPIGDLIVLRYYLLHCAVYIDGTKIGP